VPKRSARGRSAPERPEAAPGGLARDGVEQDATLPQVTGPEAVAPGAPTGEDVLARLLEQRPRGDDARSPVMEDAFAVSQRRKRQLGFDSTPEQ
jgi:hypothetical protein